jgi:hypothetical protein
MEKKILVPDLSFSDSTELENTICEKDSLYICEIIEFQLHLPVHLTMSSCAATCQSVYVGMEPERLSHIVLPKIRRNKLYHTYVSLQ